MTSLTSQALEEYWISLDAEARASKDSQGASLRMLAFYSELASSDRRVVDAVLKRWVGDGSEAPRYDALTVIDEFRIRSALPALRARWVSLQGAFGSSVPTDRTKLVRIMNRLESESLDPQ
jgi:muramidase (phage lysozyme)